MDLRRRKVLPFLLCFLSFPLLVFALKKGEKVKWGFILRDTKGEVVDIYRVLENKRCVLLNFYSEGCSECVKELPYLKEIYERNRRKGVEVFMVAVGEDEGKAREIKMEHKIPFEVLADVYGKAAEEFGIGKFFPQTFLISGSGIVEEIFFGNLSRHKERIEKLLKNFTEGKR